MRNIVLILAAIWALLVLFGFVSRGMPGAETFAILPVMVVRYGPVYGVPLGISVMGWSYAALVVLSLLRSRRVKAALEDVEARVRGTARNAGRPKDEA